jgi:hypothetical protein
MKRFIVVSGAAVLLGSVAEAQATPNFAGKWKVVPNVAPATQPPGARAPATMGSGWASEIAITQDANTLTLEYTPYAASDIQPMWKFVYPLTGAESKQWINTGHGDREQLSRAIWDGNRLVISTTQRFRNPDTGALMTSEVHRALSLDSAGSLVVETTYVGVLGGPTSTTRTLYSRN